MVTHTISPGEERHSKLELRFPQNASAFSPSLSQRIVKLSRRESGTALCLQTGSERVSARVFSHNCRGEFQKLHVCTEQVCLSKMELTLRIKIHFLNNNKKIQHA